MCTSITKRSGNTTEHPINGYPYTLPQDRATLAVLNRNLTVPAFTSGENGGVLTITTAAVQLSYVVGTGSFSAASLYVTSTNASSAFPGWKFGDAFPGNLLGTIRGLDTQVG